MRRFKQKVSMLLSLLMALSAFSGPAMAMENIDAEPMLESTDVIELVEIEPEALNDEVVLEPQEEEAEPVIQEEAAEEPAVVEEEPAKENKAAATTPVFHGTASDQSDGFYLDATTGKFVKDEGYTGDLEYSIKEDDWKGGLPTNPAEVFKAGVTLKVRVKANTNTSTSESAPVSIAMNPAPDAPKFEVVAADDCYVLDSENYEIRVQADKKWNPSAKDKFIALKESPYYKGEGGKHLLQIKGAEAFQIRSGYTATTTSATAPSKVGNLKPSKREKAPKVSYDAKAEDIVFGVDNIDNIEMYVHDDDELSSASAAYGEPGWIGLKDTPFGDTWTGADANANLWKYVDEKSKKMHLQVVDLYDASGKQPSLQVTVGGKQVDLLGKYLFFRTKAATNRLSVATKPVYIPNYATTSPTATEIHLKGAIQVPDKMEYRLASPTTIDDKFVDSKGKVVPGKTLDSALKKWNKGKGSKDIKIDKLINTYAYSAEYITLEVRVAAVKGKTGSGNRSSTPVELEIKLEAAPNVSLDYDDETALIVKTVDEDDESVANATAVESYLFGSKPGTAKKLKDDKALLKMIPNYNKSYDVNDDTKVKKMYVRESASSTDDFKSWGSKETAIALACRAANPKAVVTVADSATDAVITFSGDTNTDEALKVFYKNVSDDLEGYAYADHFDVAYVDGKGSSAKKYWTGDIGGITDTTKQTLVNTYLAEGNVAALLDYSDPENPVNKEGFGFTIESGKLKPAKISLLVKTKPITDKKGTGDAAKEYTVFAESKEAKLTLARAKNPNIKVDYKKAVFAGTKETIEYAMVGTTSTLLADFGMKPESITNTALYIELLAENDEISWKAATKNMALGDKPGFYAFRTKAVKNKPASYPILLEVKAPVASDDARLNFTIDYVKETITITNTSGTGDILEYLLDGSAATADSKFKKASSGKAFSFTKDLEASKNVFSLRLQAQNAKGTNTGNPYSDITTTTIVARATAPSVTYDSISTTVKLDNEHKDTKDGRKLEYSDKAKGGTWKDFAAIQADTNGTFTKGTKDVKLYFRFKADQEKALVASEVQDVTIPKKDN